MGRRDKKKKKKWSLAKKIIFSFGIIGILLVTALGAGYIYIRENIYDDKNINKDNINYEEVDGITNILLIGTDARNLDEQSRSDSIMILTIDNNVKKLKLTSIMRDTFVDIPGIGRGKINAAMSNGGPKLLLETINETFKLNLNKYIMVNFWGFESIIDILGGLEVDIKDYEINQLNKFIGEQHKASDRSPKILNPGVQMLDGQQALSYARIRKTGNGDYERTDRQRRVVGLIADKFKDVNPLKYPSFMTKMLPHIKTNIEPMQLLNYAYTAAQFPSLDFVQLRLPLVPLSKEGSYGQFGWVLLIDKEQHAKLVNDFIFKDIEPKEENYDVASWKAKMNAEYGHIGEAKEEDVETFVPEVKPPLKEEDKNQGGGTTTTPKPEVEKPVIKPEPETPKPETPKPEVPKPEIPKPEPPEPPKPEPPVNPGGENPTTDTSEQKPNNAEISGESFKEVA